jgi:outer membrane lipopolysaccharide assembly protein LptE/RlpB
VAQHFSAAIKAKTAAKRRKNAAQGASAGCQAGNEPAPAGRKRNCNTGSLAPEGGRHSLSAISLFLPLLLLAACGYHTAGHAITLPTDIRTIAVPAFANNTETYKIDQTLTAAVVRELVTRTHYHVVNQASDAADATLRGAVLSTYSAPLTYDSQTGRVASVLITVNLKVVLTDRRGKVLFQNPAYVFREQYEVSRELSSFFEEDSPALQRLSRDFARTLVSNILEGF